MKIPAMARVRQQAPGPGIVDLPGTVRRLVLGASVGERLRPGARIAVGVGSRGVHQIATIARSVVDALKERGCHPFIVAAMGSHGGATAEGQRALLAGYGVTEESMGVPVKTDMDAAVVGTSPVGLPIYFDQNALTADGIVLVNRIKPHTDFHSDFESGVLKMLVIGLGKRQGASQVHKLGVRGMKEVLPAVGRILLDKTPFLFGLGIIENSADRPQDIVLLDRQTILQEEPKLLNLAREAMGRLPYDQIDVLVVGELGKNYSGAGMDPNVIGRLMVETQPDLPRPVVTRLVVLDVSQESHGNIVGVGFADLTTERLVSKLDVQSFRINVLTSCFLERARIPITLPTDREVIETAIETCWRIDPETARVVLIPNTLELDTLWISRPLLDETRANRSLSVESDFMPLPFDAQGFLNQEQLFPDSVRGRRGSSSLSH